MALENYQTRYCLIRSIYTVVIAPGDQSVRPNDIFTPFWSKFIYIILRNSVSDRFENLSNELKAQAYYQ